jgi:hypothetical protein
MITFGFMEAIFVGERRRSLPASSILISAVEASDPRSGERQPLDKLGALSLSKRQADSASIVGFSLIDLNRLPDF